ncbi:transmembrane protease serine 9-like isoform 2-T2 [Aulostomus maculatus]
MAQWSPLILLTCAFLIRQGSEAQECGKAPLSPRIVGGDPSGPGWWPWQVSMHFLNYGHICGGTLISNQWVLTAAQCIISVSPDSYLLYFGKVYQTGPNPYEVNRTVSQIIVHPDFNGITFVNDIALMELSSPVSFTDYISPICLADNSSHVHTSTLCWSTGWGVTGVFEPGSETLQEVEIPVIGNQQCSCSYSPNINITDSMICAGRESQGVCWGDSGGPLQCQQGSTWIQMGINSFGLPCALPDFPGVYSRVSSFQDWITNQVSARNVSFSTYTSSGTDQDDSFACLSDITGSEAQECGKTPLSPRILGGDPSGPGWWPWQVSIHFLNYGHICGGTLISNQWVLTAAHCMITVSPDSFLLYFGKVNQTGPNPYEVNRTVSQIIVHPDYNDTTFVNDIALMELSSPVSFTDYIGPICLADHSSHVHTSTLCWSTGWGVTGVFEPGSETLQEVEIPVIGNQQCSCSYSPNINITDSMICAGRESQGVCWGDSGGPLQCQQGSTWIQMGVTSFGLPCALPDFPGVYSRVSSFQDWITNQVSAGNVSFSTYTSSGTDQDDSFACLSDIIGNVLSECGKTPLSPRIVGGDPSGPGWWPWQVSIHFLYYGHICGGTLISHQWVVTAAHCMITDSPLNYLLYFGKVNQTGPNPHQVSRLASQIIVHPDYNDATLTNDIALIRLSRPVNFTDYISPICLADNSSHVNNATLCWSTGWGRTGANDSPSDTLLEVEIPVIGNQQCSCSYRQITNITDSMICAGRESHGVCMGDSGGPLQCQQGTTWIQMGITSFGIPCALAEYPAVYSRVSSYEDWIKKEVTAANVSFLTYTSSGTDQDNSFVCRSDMESTIAPTTSIAPPTTSAASPIAADLSFLVILLTLFFSSVTHF